MISLPEIDWSDATDCIVGIVWNYKGTPFWTRKMLVQKIVDDGEPCWYYWGDDCVAEPIFVEAPEKYRISPMTDERWEEVHPVWRPMAKQGGKIMKKL